MSITRERALALLSTGNPPAVVASILDVDESRISQFLAEESFKTELTEKKFSNMQKHNARDTEADSLEDMLLDKMKNLIPFVNKPMEAARIYQIVNGAKRRGISSPESVINQQAIVNISLPTKVINNFTVNTVNQVIKAGEQELVTMQSSVLLSKVKTQNASGKVIESSSSKETSNALTKLREKYAADS